MEVWGEGCLLWLSRSTVATPQGSLPSSLFSDIFSHIFCSHQTLRKHFIARCCQESTHVKINTTSFYVLDIRIPSSCPLQYSRAVAVFLCFCPRKLSFLKSEMNGLLCIYVKSIFMNFWCFDIFLTVHHSIDFLKITNLMPNSFILQQYVCYITILNMFRAAPCLSSEGQIVLLQPLVSSVSVNSRTVCRLRLSTCILYGCLQRLTIPEAVVIQFVLLRMSRVLLETCWGS